MLHISGELMPGCIPVAMKWSKQQKDDNNTSSKNFGHERKCL